MTPYARTIKASICNNAPELYFMYAKAYEKYETVAYHARSSLSDIIQAPDMSPDITTILSVTALGYLLGSIPFGLLLTLVAGHGDVRKIGSGNIGATNVLRTGNKGLAATTLLLDVLKGAIGVFLCAYLWNSAEMGYIGGLAAFLGHLFPVWLRFKGGKGVATYIGVLIGIYWVLAVIFCIVWISTAYISRISSLSALLAALVVPAVLAVHTLWTGNWIMLIVVSIMSLLVYIRHHANISRIIKGEEPRIGASKS